MNSLTFEDMLHESAVGPFLTVNSSSSLGVWGITVRDVNMADSQGNPLPPLIDAHCKCGGIRGVQVINSTTDGAQLTTGDPISDLEVWSADPRAGYKISQSTGYVLHTPAAIYNAMPTYQLAATPDFSLVPNALTSQAVRLGESASFELNLTASAGFHQTVELSCSGGPPGSTCEVSPSTDALIGPASLPVSATIATVAQTTAVPSSAPGTVWSNRSSWLLTVMAGFFGLILVTSLFHKGNLEPQVTRTGAIFVLTVFVAVWISSCARVVAGGSAAPTNPQNPPAPAIKYTITVVGNCTSCSPTLSHSANLSLTLQ
jgi:hypothetical protein